MAIPLVLVVLTWLVAWIYYPDTFSGVFPLADTWETVRADFRMVRDDFQSTTPPVEYAGGWAFLAGATMAATVWLADTFAFRAQARARRSFPEPCCSSSSPPSASTSGASSTSLAVVGAGFCALALLRQRLERRPRTVLGRPLHPLVTAIPGIACAGAVVLAVTGIGIENLVVEIDVLDVEKGCTARPPSKSTRTAPRRSSTAGISS